MSTRLYNPLLVSAAYSVLKIAHRSSPVARETVVVIIVTTNEPKDGQTINSTAVDRHPSRKSVESPRHSPPYNLYIHKIHTHIYILLKYICICHIYRTRTMFACLVVVLGITCIVLHDNIAPVLFSTQCGLSLRRLPYLLRDCVVSRK